MPPAEQDGQILLCAVEQLESCRANVRKCRRRQIDPRVKVIMTYEEPHRGSKTHGGESVQWPGRVNVNGVTVLSSTCSVTTGHVCDWFSDLIGY